MSKSLSYGQRDDRGASSVEYALLASFIAAVIIVAVAALGNTVAGLFDLTWP